MGISLYKKGFTLVELIIVIGITAIISGAIIFSGSFNKQEVLIEGAQDDFISFLSYMQGRALTGDLQDNFDEQLDARPQNLIIELDGDSSIAKFEGALEDEYIDTYTLLHNAQILGSGTAIIIQMETGELCYTDLQFPVPECTGRFDITLIRDTHVATIEVDTNANTFNKK